MLPSPSPFFAGETVQTLRHYASSSRQPSWTPAGDPALLEPLSGLGLSPVSFDMPAGPPDSSLKGLEVPARLSIPLVNPFAAVETLLGQPVWLASAHTERQEKLGLLGFAKCEKCLGLRSVL